MAKPFPNLRFCLRPYYARRPWLWGEPLRQLDSRTAVSRRWNYVCLRVPKAANSTVVMTPTDRFPEDGIPMTGLDVDATADARKNAMTHFSQLGPGRTDLRGYFVFGFVRNPYHRVLSAFLDKIGDVPDPGGRVTDEQVRFRNLYGAAIAAHDKGRISFRGFCRYLGKGGERQNAHWAAQTRILRLADRVDFIGRVESLGPDLDHVVATIAGGGRIERLHRAGPPPTRANERAGAFYDDECRALVEGVYRADFDRLGYRRGDI
jgi:hypothetical protein